MRTGPTQLQKQPTRLKYRPFYSTLLKIDSVQKKKKNLTKGKKYHVKSKPAQNLEFRLPVSGDMTWHGLCSLQCLNLLSKSRVS